jgi:hypothetical protein
MKPRLPHLALGTLPLLVAGLTVVPGAVTASAGAACAPSQVYGQHHSQASAKVRITRGSVRVTKRHRKKYVARTELSATQGRARARLVVTLCPDGTAGSAVSTTQAGTGRAVTHRAVTGRGTTAAAARRAAKRSARRVTAAMRRAGASRAGRRKARQRALNAATALVARKAHDALYLSDVVYVVTGADDVLHLTSVPPAGGVRLGSTAVGDLVLTVPAGYQPRSATSEPCVRRAPAWPTSLVFDGGDLTAPVLQAAAAQATGIASYGIDAAPSPDPTGAVAGQQATFDQSWFGGWQSGSGAATYDATIAPDTPAAAPLVCFQPTYPVTAGYVATLRGAHVGAAASAVGGDLKVVGGLPVLLR